MNGPAIADTLIAMAVTRRKKGPKAAPEKAQDLPVPIVCSKLYPPPLASDTIRRKRLLSLAPAVAHNPVTLVSAPAGYGKSTLVSHWLQQIDCKSAWLSLDPADSDMTQFLSYLVAALRGACPDSCADTVEMLRSKVLPDTGPAAGVFCNDLEQLEEAIVLVLDDYYQISSSEVDNFVDTVLNRPPRNLHLVIVSRRDPGLSLQAFRARGTLSEVRVKQLAFTEEESRAFVHASLGNAIPDSEISRLHERIEGWPAALRLAILAAPEPNATTSFVDRIPGDMYAVRAYLMQEVLAKQPVEVRECLLRVAFLGRFCAELCDAITPDGSGVIPGREFVSFIRQAGLFSISLDAKQDWFRFHHLFQALLQDQAVIDLGDEAIRSIHVRAATWFEGHGLLEEAMRHLLRADRTSEAAAVIVRHRHDIMNSEQWHRLKIWLQLLPPQIVASRPELLLLKARIFRTTGQNAEFIQTLEEAESLLDTAVVDDALNRELHGSLASMRCYQFYMMSDGESAARAARQALEYLPKDGFAERGFAMVILGAALQMTGDANSARSKICAAMADESADGNANATYVTRLLAALCFVHWMEAELKELNLAAKNAEELCAQAGLYEVLTGALQFKAAVHYHRNELSTVEGDLKELLCRKAINSPEFHAHSLIISSLTHEELGDSDEALRISESLHERAFRTHNTYLIDLSEAFAAELALRQGRVAEALKWADQYDPEPFVPMYAFFAPPLCLAKILVLDDSAGRRKRAQALLDKLEDYLTEIHNTRFLMETLALKAILSGRAGKTTLALKQLGRAVSFAQPGGFIRVFVDIGPKLIPLLNRLELEGEILQYVGRILAAFQPKGGPKGIERSDAKTGVVIQDAAGLPSPLSPREKEVLALLVERLSNKEIGERLFIATPTVKRHAQTIYEKLNVKGRREAVTKAIGLGLFSDEANSSKPPG